MRNMIAAVFTLILISAQAQAKPVCVIFGGPGLSKGIHDVSLIADRDSEKSAFELIARDRYGRGKASGLFDCVNNKKEAVSYCRQDDDAGTFWVSWDDGITLQSKYFALMNEKERPLQFIGRPTAVADDKDFVLNGKEVPCPKDLLKSRDQN